MERRPPPTEGNDTAENASIFGVTSASNSGERKLHLANEADIPQRGLMDLSVKDGAEYQAIVAAPYRARIRIQLHDTGVSEHPNLLVYIANHLQGRFPYPTVEPGDVLDIIYGIHTDSAASAAQVRDFAKDTARVLGLSEADILHWGIDAVTEAKFRAMLIAAGIEPPDLRLV
jgi:hypothetical protein